MVMEDPIPPGIVMTSIAAGQNHACGVLATTGKAYCWPRDRAAAAAPAVPETVGAVVAVFAGLGDHVCAIRASDGTLAC